MSKHNLLCKSCRKPLTSQREFTVGYHLECFKAMDEADPTFCYWVFGLKVPPHLIPPVMCLACYQEVSADDPAKWLKYCSPCWQSFALSNPSSATKHYRQRRKLQEDRP
jgi:hypothetical protein